MIDDLLIFVCGILSGIVLIGFLRLFFLSFKDWLGDFIESKIKLNPRREY